MNESELLFTELLDCSRTDLYLNRDHTLDKNKASFVAAVLKRRINGEPIQYILGKTEFMGLEFKVTPDVLIPRQETEILVETAVRLAPSSKLQAPSLNILDIGTGSGCIAISLAKLLLDCSATATDISVNALTIARENAALHKVQERVGFFLSDIFRNYDPRPMTYDLILCNPPYIASSQIDKLQPEIQYEPRIALDGGEDGLDFYRRIVQALPRYLKPDGLLVMEMGFGQCPRIKELIEFSGEFEIMDVVRDYSGIDRVIVARKSGY